MSKTPLFVGILAVTLFISSSAQAGSSALSVAPTPTAQVLAASPSSVSGVQDLQRVSLTEIQGEVFYQKAGEPTFSRASSGIALSTGDTIKTGEGSCEIVFDDQSRISIAPGTQITLSEAFKNLAANTRSTLLKLDLGKLKAKITKVTPGSRFEITTPSAVAAVRGTTLILESLLLNGKYIAKLYVDESKSGVLFTNTETGDSEFVPAYSDSSSSDGDVEEPKETDEEEQNKLNEDFEEDNLLDDSVDPLLEDNTDPNASGEETDDAELDKTSEQNTSGGAVQDDIEESAGDPNLDAQNEAERLLISQEIARLTGDLDFNHADANLAQISDAQTGKVMTDVHGNRVRVDQYVFKEAQTKGGDIVRFLSLTARTGEYQNGVTSVLFGAAFNTSIAVPIRDLPWDEYLNVVTDDEFQVDYNPDAPYADQVVNQYIVHESAVTEPSLYPTQFFVEFGNPRRPDGGRDIVGFEEFYSNPYQADSLSQDGTTFWVQARTGDLTRIKQYGGDDIISGYDITDGSFLFINSVEQTVFGGNGGGDGSQTASFASLFDTSKLLSPGAINYYRNLEINSDGDPTNDEHPAYFEDNYLIGDGFNSLIGVFIPINDSGQIHDVPGYRPESLRDLMSPNPLVNGGNYNLEVIFFYGTEVTLLDPVTRSTTTEFQELFRIDAIITPEIFSDIGTINQSSYFPSTLYPDDDDNDYGSYV